MAILIGIIFLCAILGIGSLIFWGLGLLIVKVFGLTYVWTFWHGLVCEIIYIILKEIFGKN